MCLAIRTWELQRHNGRKLPQGLKQKWRFFREKRQLAAAIAGFGTAPWRPLPGGRRSRG